MKKIIEKKDKGNLLNSVDSKPRVSRRRKNETN